MSVLPAVTAHVVRPQPAWWTEADQAEWSLFTHELAQGCAEHHEHCPECAERFPCAKVSEAFALADEWLCARKLRSRADHLRAEQERVAA